MRLSIIVPVYNVKPYLARCVDSLCDQAGLSDYEIILVDDGSPDRCGQMCDSWAEKDSRITAIPTEPALQVEVSLVQTRVVSVSADWVHSDSQVRPLSCSLMVSRVI